jgi:hypothetical protein
MTFQICKTNMKQMNSRLKFSLVLFFALAGWPSLFSQSLQFRLSYDNTIIGERCTRFRSSPGIDFEYIFSEDQNSQFYAGLGIAYFRPKASIFRSTSNSGAASTVSYSNVPMLPLRVGIRQALFSKSTVSPTVGLSMGYYLCYFDENTTGVNGSGGQGFAGGMIGVAPTVGVVFGKGQWITYSAEARTHFMGNVGAELFWSYLDLGFQVGVWL